MDWSDKPGHRPVWAHADANGVVYSFLSVHQGWVVRVAVPSDTYIRLAETVALAAAYQGYRFRNQSRVDRVRV